MSSHDYQGARVHIDTLIECMYRQRWYSMLHAHLTAVTERIGKDVKKPKDISSTVYPTICTVLFAVPLVQHELPEMKEIGKLLSKLCGALIDEQVGLKGYTHGLIKGDHVSLPLVDSHMVSNFPGGSWMVDPEERYKMVVRLCTAKNITIVDIASLQHVMGHRERRSNVKDNTKSYTNVEQANIARTSTEASTLSSDTESFEGMFVDGKKMKKKKNKEHIEETWETVFDRQQGGSVPSPNIVKTHGGWQVASHHSPQSSTGTNDTGGRGLPPVISAPGWQAPSPQRDCGNSFEKKIDNLGEYHHRMKSSDTNEDEVPHPQPSSKDIDEYLARLRQ
jgi:hypothetical protein